MKCKWKMLHHLFIIFHSPCRSSQQLLFLMPMLLWKVFFFYFTVTLQSDRNYQFFVPFFHYSHFHLWERKRASISRPRENSVIEDIKQENNLPHRLAVCFSEICQLAPLNNIKNVLDMKSVVCSAALCQLCRKLFQSTQEQWLAHVSVIG